MTWRVNKCGPNQWLGLRVLRHKGGGRRLFIGMWWWELEVYSGRPADRHSCRPLPEEREVWAARSLMHEYHKWRKRVDGQLGEVTPDRLTLLEKRMSQVEAHETPISHALYVGSTDGGPPLKAQIGAGSKLKCPECQVSWMQGTPYDAVLLVHQRGCSRTHAPVLGGA